MFLTVRAAVSFAWLTTTVTHGFSTHRRREYPRSVVEDARRESSVVSIRGKLKELLDEYKKEALQASVRKAKVPANAVEANHLGQGLTTSGSTPGFLHMTASLDKARSGSRHRRRHSDAFGDPQILPTSKKSGHSAPSLQLDPEIVGRGKRKIIEAFRTKSWKELSHDCRVRGLSPYGHRNELLHRVTAYEYMQQFPEMPQEATSPVDEESQGMSAFTEEAYSSHPAETHVADEDEKAQKEKAETQLQQEQDARRQEEQERERQGEWRNIRDEAEAQAEQEQEARPERGQELKRQEKLLEAEAEARLWQENEARRQEEQERKRQDQWRKVRDEAEERKMQEELLKANTKDGSKFVKDACNGWCENHVDSWTTKCSWKSKRCSSCAGCTKENTTLNVEAPSRLLLRTRAAEGRQCGILWFYHIPKCGGMSVFKWLSNAHKQGHFDDLIQVFFSNQSDVLPNIGTDYDQFHDEYIEPYVANPRGKLVAVHHHHHTPGLLNFTERFASMKRRLRASGCDLYRATFVREPESRLSSALMYNLYDWNRTTWLSGNGDSHLKGWDTKAVSAVEEIFSNQKLASSYNNREVDYLLNNNELDSLHLWESALNPHLNLTAAIDILRSFEFVGLTEELSAGIDQISFMLGLNDKVERLQSAHTNSGTHTTDLTMVPGHLLTMIRENVGLDAQLYAEARSLWAAKFAAPRATAAEFLAR